MKKILTFLCVFYVGAAWAFPTYFFRVKLSGVRTVSQVNSFFSGRGRKDGGQPFVNTYILPTPDTTNYVLVKITPQNDTEDGLCQRAFSLAGVDLWAEVILIDGQEPQFVVDNRALFPIDTDYTVHPST